MKRTEYVSAKANGMMHAARSDQDEIIIAFYGPNGGTRALESLSIESAKALRDALTLTIHRMVGGGHG